MMDINGWSYWIENTERIKSELISNKANIKGLNKRERLEYADLENQHNEQKSNKVLKNKIPRKTRFSKKCFTGGKIFCHTVKKQKGSYAANRL
ncbi:MAG: hypothetical protein PHC69_01715 [Ruminiclostridium sp.]|nr:hypothetical protein [Ruminiclostridium sp.]